MFNDINLTSPEVSNEWVRNETIAVPNTVIQISPALNRKMIFIRNDSTNANEIIHVMFGKEVATITKPFKLRQNEYISDSDNAGYQCYKGNITAICEVAGPGSLMVVER
jgi:hypothetical protein